MSSHGGEHHVPTNEGDRMLRHVARLSNRQLQAQNLADVTIKKASAR